MSEEEEERKQYAPVWGIFVLFLGIVFLLQTFNVLPWDLWGTLWRFWPVVLIAGGASILLRQHNIWLVSALVLGLFLACLGVAIWQYGADSGPEQAARMYSEPLDGLEQARIQVDFSGGAIAIRSLPSGSPNFMEAGPAATDGNTALESDFHRQDSQGELRLSRRQGTWGPWNREENSWEARFSRDLPLAFELRLTASDVDLDLTELQVSDIDMDVDVGSYTVRLPSSSGTVCVNIEADLSNLELTIPQGMAAKLVADVDLSLFEVDESRFSRDGDCYMSQDFDSSEDRVVIELDCDLCRVQVR